MQFISFNKCRLYFIDYSDGSFNQHGQNTVSKGRLSYKQSFLFVTVMAVLLSNGCAVFGLRQDLSILEQTAEVSGKVAATHNSESPIFVALYQDNIYCSY